MPLAARGTVIAALRDEPTRVWQTISFENEVEKPMNQAKSK